MKRAFVIRPFGVKEGVDFDETQRRLINPVLEELGFSGGEATQIVASGNIRGDMFMLLLAADLVIADISIHNANVYYELGIRHALRDRMTVLIRARIAEVPFDLKTDRYLTYDPTDPASARTDLRKGQAPTTTDIGRIERCSCAGHARKRPSPSRSTAGSDVDRSSTA